ncbi:MAG: acetoacetate decarboxylase family protein, partial [archaeon]|nr:acetoacetate decarboxylase family protein [archaeon]
MTDVNDLEEKVSEFCVLESHSMQAVLDVDEDKHELYRSLLPKNLEMPEVPKIILYFINNSKMAFPHLNPYTEAGIFMRANFPNYKAGWHVVNMAVDEEMSLKAGIAVGFPKYIPDVINFNETDNGWIGQVKHGDNYIFDFLFTYKEVNVPWKDTLHIWDPQYLPLRRFPRLFIVELKKTQEKVETRLG